MTGQVGAVHGEERDGAAGSADLTAGTRQIAFVGAGPRTTSLLERLAANAPELLGDGPVVIHVVDPFPPGGGRIWRHEQSPLLWMNSVAEDVTMFTDSSVTCAGPIVPGPSLDEWVLGAGRPHLHLAGLAEAADRFSAKGFPTRQIQSHYLAWVFDRAVAALPENVTVTVHADRAVALVDGDRTSPVTDAPVQVLDLAGGTRIELDLVVLAQGYLDQSPESREAALLDQAREAGLTYVPPGYTADLDLSGLRAGESVIVRGFGLAFIDLMVLLGQQRGGSFRTEADGSLTYLPSGREPVLHVGSRRGVPYHAKLGYPLPGTGPVPPRVFTAAAIAAATPGDRPVDFDRDLWPLIVRELTLAHYRELFASHPDRVEGIWAEIEPRLIELDPSDAEYRALIEATVPEVSDRFEVAAIDRPLAGREFADAGEFGRAVAGHIADDLARRADPRYSMDGAVFQSLLTVYGGLIPLLGSGRISTGDRIRRIEGAFHGFFSFLASGPPPQRLSELLALHRAGLVHFAGPDLEVSLVDGSFLASSPVVPGRIRTRAFVEARLPRPDVLATADPLVAGLLRAGELKAETLPSADGTGREGGQLLADPACRAVRPDGTVHVSRYLLGPGVSGSAGSSGFSRPGFNSPFLRQNDGVAREILSLVARSQQREDTISIRENSYAS